MPYIKNQQTMKLYKDDYVLVDDQYNPIEKLDIVYTEDALRDLYYDGHLDEDEINQEIISLKEKGEILFEGNPDGWKLVSMTKLPKSLQQKYLDYFKSCLDETNLTFNTSPYI